LTAADKVLCYCFSFPLLLFYQASVSWVDCFAHRFSRGGRSRLYQQQSLLSSLHLLLSKISHTLLFLLSASAEGFTFFFLEVTCSGNVGMLCVFDFAFHVLVLPSDIRPLIQCCCCHPPLRPRHWSTLLKLEIAKLFGKHAQCLDGEDEFVVRVGNHAIMLH
jgi:hypothetical protein